VQRAPDQFNVFILQTIHIEVYNVRTCHTIFLSFHRCHRIAVHPSDQKPSITSTTSKAKQVKKREMPSSWGIRQFDLNTKPTSPHIRFDLPHHPIPNMYKGNGEVKNSRFAICNLTEKSTQTFYE
jgi:hypothetical protein